MLIQFKEMVKSIYFSLSLSTALLESPFCSYEMKSHPTERTWCWGQTFSPKTLISYSSGCVYSWEEMGGSAVLLYSVWLQRCRFKVKTSPPISSILTGREHHSAAEQRRRQGQLFGERWKHLLQSALNTNLCNIISKVCLHQFMALRWVALPFLQLFWHGCCHSRDRSLGICRRSYDFLFFFFSHVNWSSLKNHQNLLAGWHASKALFPSFSYRRYAQSVHSLAPATGVGTREEQEGKATEAKLMKWSGSAEGFWASPQITWIMTT